MHSFVDIHRIFKSAARAGRPAARAQICLLFKKELCSVGIPLFKKELRSGALRAPFVITLPLASAEKKTPIDASIPACLLFQLLYIWDGSSRILRRQSKVEDGFQNDREQNNRLSKGKG